MEESLERAFRLLNRAGILSLSQMAAYINQSEEVVLRLLLRNNKKRNQYFDTRTHLVGVNLETVQAYSGKNYLAVWVYLQFLAAGKACQLPVFSDHGQGVFQYCFACGEEFFEVGYIAENEEIISNEYLKFMERDYAFDREETEHFHRILVLHKKAQAEAITVKADFFCTVTEEGDCQYFPKEMK